MALFPQVGLTMCELKPMALFPWQGRRRRQNRLDLPCWHRPHRFHREEDTPLGCHPENLSGRGPSTKTEHPPAPTVCRHARGKVPRAPGRPP